MPIDLSINVQPEKASLGKSWSVQLEINRSSLKTANISHFAIFKR